MRASNSAWIGPALLLALVPWTAGCSKEVKVDFPRPPATATMTIPEEEEASPAPAPPAEPVASDPVEAPPEEEEEPAPVTTETEPPRRPPTRATPAPEEPIEPPSTALSSPEIDPELAAKLDRARSLLGSISGRSLTSEQSQQLVAARGFVAQARQALDEGDQRRAIVLIDKGLILAEDVERLSRR